MNKFIHLPTLIAHFDLPLKSYQIPQFRGAVAESAGWNETLFHNHLRTEIEEEDNSTNTGELLVKKQITLKDKYVYRYPAIHYRTIRGQAGIYAIGKQGCRALRNWLLTKTDTFYMLGRKQELYLNGLKEDKHCLQMTERPRRYRIKNYLGLNQANFERWQEESSMTRRLIMLEDVLVGHILGFCESMGYQLPEHLEVEVAMLYRSRGMKLHDTPRLAFDLDFRANIELPDGMALGKGVSHGFGVLRGL